MSASPAPPSPGLSAASVCSFRLSRLSSWRVHAGLVSHSTVRPHQGAVVQRIITHPLYSAQNHDYDVALLQLRTPLHFSGEAAVRGWRVGATRVPRSPPCCESYNGLFTWGPSWTLGTLDCTNSSTCSFGDKESGPFHSWVAGGICLEAPRRASQ